MAALLSDMKCLLRRSRDVDFADQGMGWHFFSISWVKNCRQECPNCQLSLAAGCYFEPCYSTGDMTFLSFSLCLDKPVSLILYFQQTNLKHPAHNEILQQGSH